MQTAPSAAFGYESQAPDTLAALKQARIIIDNLSGIAHGQPASGTAIGWIDRSILAECLAQNRREFLARANGIPAEQQVPHLIRDYNRAVHALRELRDHQNGCPLPKYEQGWTNAMQLAGDILEGRDGNGIPRPPGQTNKEIGQPTVQQLAADADAHVTELTAEIAQLQATNASLGERVRKAEGVVAHYGNTGAAARIEELMAEVARLQGLYDTADAERNTLKPYFAEVVRLTKELDEATRQAGYRKQEGEELARMNERLRAKRVAEREKYATACAALHARNKRLQVDRDRRIRKLADNLPTVNRATLEEFKYNLTAELAEAREIIAGAQIHIDYGPNTRTGPWHRRAEQFMGRAPALPADLAEAVATTHREIDKLEAMGHAMHQGGQPGLATGETAQVMPPPPGWEEAPMPPPPILMNWYPITQWPPAEWSADGSRYPVVGPAGAGTASLDTTRDTGWTHYGRLRVIDVYHPGSNPK